MKKEPPRPADEGYGYGYGYGYNPEGPSYGYGYGYSDYGAPATRSLRDYFLILRERFWILCTVGFSVFFLALVYTFQATPKFLSVSRVQVLRTEVGAIFDRDPNAQVANDVDFQTQIKILEGGEIINQVARRLREEELRRLRAPYENPLFAFTKPASTEEILAGGRRIVPIRATLVVAIQFTHPDAEIAAIVANLFAEEYINYNLRLQRENSERAAEDLRARADRQGREVEKIELELAQFKEQHKSVAFDASSDIDQQALLRLNEMLTADRRTLDEAETRWTQVRTFTEQGRDLWEISFIASLPQVNEQIGRLASFRIQEAQLAQRYRDLHPRMIEIRDAIRQTRDELARGVAAAAEAIKSDYERARENLVNSESRLAHKQDEIIQLQKLRVTYNTLVRNLQVNQQHYQFFYTRMQQAMANASNEAETARIIDKAAPAPDPYLPRKGLNLAIGLVGGFGLGAALVLLLAFFDDKIKSAFDIETVVELPLLGLVPRLKKKEATEKARIVLDNHEKQTVEAFRAIHSTLKLGEETRRAKVILSTSTIPSEGKSFVSTNLAITFANHGERVCLVDCDLRMPNVAKSLGIENRKGLLTVIEKGGVLDECIQRDVAPGLDVLPTGGRARSPTQALGSEAFARVMAELRERYDRVFIDSPPLAPVSDALTLLPHVDGVIYVIRFNKVKRKTARTQVRRIFEGKVPVYGAILNNIAASVASYYYAHYYDQTYSEYYLAEEDEEAEARGEQPKRRRKKKKDGSAPAETQPATTPVDGTQS